MRQVEVLDGDGVGLLGCGGTHFLLNVEIRRRVLCIRLRLDYVFFV